MNSAAIETPVTEPIGDQHDARAGSSRSARRSPTSRATRSPGLAPRSFISGNSTGATAAMSAAFDPEMPDTRYIAPTST